MSLAELLPRRGIDAGPAETHTHTQAPPAPVAAASPIRPALIGGAVGAACGIAAAIATVFVWNNLHPPVDVRLDPVAVRLTAVEGTLKDLNGTLGPIQTELANFYDVTTDLTARMDAADSDTQALLGDLQSALIEQADLMTVGSPVFAVAVSQLRAAALAGLPFEAELLNVYALSAGDPSVDDALHQLVNASRTGIESDQVLRQTLAVAAAAAGIGIGPRATVYDYGVSMLANYVGISNESYVKEVARQLILTADQQLAQGDPAGALETMRGVDRSIAPKFDPWFAEVEARIAEDNALATVIEVVRASISGKLLDQAG